MTALNIFLFITAALVSTVCCSTCKLCLGRYRTDCEVTMDQTCENNGCITVSENCNLYNQDYPSIYKNCSIPVFCGMLFSLSNNDGVKLRVKADCCDGENCNENTQYNVPMDVGSPNGKYCDSCFEENLDNECTSTGKVQCSGNEDKCINYIGKALRSDNVIVNYSIKGCIYSPGCLYRFKVLPGTEELDTKLFECSDPITLDK